MVSVLGGMGERERENDKERQHKEKGLLYMDLAAE
jgi:hypothetical protein